MPQEKSRPRRLPFAYSTESEQLNDEITARVERRATALRQGLMSPSNVYRMKHGRKWQTMHASNPEDSIELRKHSTETTVSRQAVIDHDVRQLTKFLTDVSNKMHQLFMQNMIETLDDSTQRSGNIVSAKGKGFKQSFEEMLSKIAFGVDRYGKPSAPQALVPPALMKQIEELIHTPDPEHEARVTAITERKRNEAIADEARRISRYRIAR